MAKRVLTLELDRAYDGMSLQELKNCIDRLVTDQFESVDFEIREDYGSFHGVFIGRRKETDTEYKERLDHAKNYRANEIDRLKKRIADLEKE